MRSFSNFLAQFYGDERDQHLKPKPSKCQNPDCEADAVYLLPTTNGNWVCTYCGHRHDE